MWPNPSEELPSFDSEQWTTPDRSVLFALKPVGLGTDRVESLSSYVTRLARAHGVSPRRLIREEFRRRAPQPEQMRWLGHTSQQMSMDGLGKFSQFLVPLLTQLTTIHQLQYLTLLPLSDLIPRNGPHQLARHPRWCPDCYLEQVRAGEEVSRRLLWSLELYRVCHRHKSVMLDVCPTCGGLQRFIPVFPDLAHCSGCGESLALAPLQGQRVTAMDLWKSRALADLVAHLSEISREAARSKLVSLLDRAIQLEVEGRRYPFGHAIRFILVFTRNWVAEGKMLSLARLLEVGYYLDTLPSAMLREGGDAELYPERFRTERAAIRTARPFLGITERKKLGRYLDRVAEDQSDIRSVAEVAKALGYQRTCLKYWFPKQCQGISLKSALGRRRESDEKHLAEQRKLTELVKEAFSSPVPIKHRMLVEELNAHGLYLVRKDLEKTFRSCMEEGSELD